MAIETRATTVERSEILKRLLVTLVCLIFLEVVGFMIKLSALFQYGYLLISKKRSEPLRLFCNNLAQYGYRIMRYATLNENKRPFPFGEFPKDEQCEQPEKQVQYR